MLTVSISELRKNIANYLEKASKGTKVLIHDERKNLAIAQITRIKSFDGKMYQKVLARASGIFTKEAHPEWTNTKKISSWLTRNRLSDERTF